MLVPVILVGALALPAPPLRTQLFTPLPPALRALFEPPPASSALRLQPLFLPPGIAVGDFRRA